MSKYDCALKSVHMSLRSLTRVLSATALLVLSWALLPVAAHAATLGNDLSLGDSSQANLYDTPIHVYGGALHSVAAHTSATAPVASHDGSERAQGTAATTTGSFSILSRLSVAANSAAGLPRNALGQFTSGAGGDSAAAAAGRSAHASYPNTLGWSGDDLVQFNQTMPGSSLRPDAINWTQRVVGELKPANPSAISAGWRQVNGYKAYLEELTGQPWTAQVDVYTP